MEDFNSFRNRILDHYADFLEGEWHEYEPLMPETRYKTPKPSQAPDALTMPPDGDDASGVELSSSTFSKATHAMAPGDTVASVDYIPVSGKPDTQFELPPHFDLQRSNAPREGMESLVFHDMEFLIPAYDYELWKTYTMPSDVSKQWYKLNRAKVGKEVVPVLQSLCKELGLNGYLTYDLLCHYVDGKFPEDGIIGKVSLVHYLLANMGYDARIGFSAIGDPVILMRTDQKLYGVERISLDENTLYYMFNPLGREIGSVRTCYIPSSPDMGEKFDFRLNGLNLPMREGRYDIALGKIHLNGTINQNIFPVIYRYPQLECSDIAESCLLSGVREDVTRQVKEQLKDLDTLDAVNELLNFTQLGFDYATDPDFHGFEKPYFFEENLFYPFNDCEDRAIFYTYLLWNALGVENHLLEYPEHESAAVALPVGIKGTGYRINGKKYYISDPTYLHTKTGACMPCFRRTVPVINFRYASVEGDTSTEK